MRKIALIFFWILAIVSYQLTKMIVVLDRAFKFKLRFPRSVDQFVRSQSWCVQTLQAAGALPKDIEVLSYSIAQADPELIFRSDAIACTIRYKHQQEEFDLKFGAKFSPSSGDVRSRVIYNLQQNHIKEVQFYKEMAGSLTAKLCPEIYYAEFNALTANMCILMEYIDNHEEYDEFRGCPEYLIPVVARKFAELHVAFWNIPNNSARGISSIPLVVADFFQSYGRMTNWSKEALTLYERSWQVVNTPQTVIHGDARVGNILFPKDNSDELVLID